MSALRNKTVRWRLALLFATLILVTGVVLLVLSYVLVNANLSYKTQSPPVTGQSLTSHARGGVHLGPMLGTSGAQVAHHERSALLVQYAVILGVLILIAALTAWLIAGRVLRPLRTITAGARRITGERLHERLALGGPPDEIKDLGDTFDAMLARLEVAFQHQQLFAANAAHELRTPLGVMHAELDLALADEPSADQQAVLWRLKRTVVACERLTERLLSLTRGWLAATERYPVALDRVAVERLTLAQPAAHELAVKDDMQPVMVEGDPALLGQLVENLIENAIKYNVPDGWIEMRVYQEHEHAILEVANSGPHVPANELDSLLEPFRRATQQRVGTGNGLGLSIVRTIVRAHNGQLTLTALAEGGLRVTVTLPCSQEQHDPVAAADRHFADGHRPLGRIDLGRHGHHQPAAHTDS